MNKPENLLEKINRDSSDYSSKEYDINYYNTRIASEGALVVAIGASLILNLLFPLSIKAIVSVLYVLNIIFDVFFAERLFGVKFKRAMDIYCVAYLMATIPVQWFGTGGSYGGVGAIWAVFAVIYCIFGIKGKAQNILLSLFGILMLGTVALNVYYPELASSISRRDNMILVVFSTFGAGGYIQIVSFIQNKQVDEDKMRLIELQDELSSHFEESVAMNDELTKTASSLELANKTQRSFNASMNHELRAPLNGIEGCLQILLMDDQLSEESRETVINALTASKTINQTVNDILDFAKLEEGRFEIVKRPFDLRDILDNISTIFRPQANAKNLKFIIQIPKDTRVSIVGDSVRIQQIITNLVSNAVKYTKEGTVTLSVKTERGHLLFNVTDTGQGMDEASLKVLFDPFTRFNTDENINVQGTGLGMNIVYNMVKEMKGNITVKSKVNKGTEFNVDIPILFYDSAVKYSSERSRYSDNDSAVDLTGVRVLCVDDTEINRTVFKGLLKKTGASITTIDSGKKAIRLCEKTDYDIIFIDHMMPEMDGIETMKSIRNISGGRFEDTKIVMFTGNAGDEYRKMYKEAGADGYLLKPIMYADLIACF